MKEARPITVWFHLYKNLYKILENTNPSTVTERRAVVALDSGQREEWTAKGRKDTFTSDRIVLYLDYGHGFTKIYTSQNSSNLLHSNYTSLKLIFGNK